MKQDFVDQVFEASRKKKEKPYVEGLKVEAEARLKLAQSFFCFCFQKKDSTHFICTQFV